MARRPALKFLPFAGRQTKDLLLLHLTHQRAGKGYVRLFIRSPPFKFWHFAFCCSYWGIMVVAILFIYPLQYSALTMAAMYQRIIEGWRPSGSGSASLSILFCLIRSQKCFALQAIKINCFRKRRRWAADIYASERVGSARLMVVSYHWYVK